MASMRDSGESLHFVDQEGTTFFHFYSYSHLLLHQTAPIMSLRPGATRLPLRQLFRQTTSSRPFHQRITSRPQQNLLHQSQPQRRHASFTSNARTLFRQNPVSVSLALLALASGIAALAYTNYLYQYYILRAFHNYPEEVGTCHIL